jgi:hypothetical protein
MSRVILHPSAAAADHVGHRAGFRRVTEHPAIRTGSVYVVHTSVADTLVAIRVANDFGAALGVPVTVVHFRTVPYAAPVDEPDGVSPIETAEFAGRLRDEEMNVRLRVYLCRDERRAVTFAFQPHSLIVMAGRRSWWPTVSERRRRLLEAAGHFVLFVDTAEHGVDASHDGGELSSLVAVTEETIHA